MLCETAPIYTVRSATMEGFHMTVDLFTRALRTVRNWMSPGPDCIHGYWLTYFHSVHPVLLRYFNSFLSTGGATLEPSLLAGRTTLIMKNVAKGSVPNNYCPITCLSTIWK